MKVKIRVAGVILGKAIKESFEHEIVDGASIEGLFKALDKDKKKRITKGFFTGLLTMPRPPSILLNGDRLVPSQDARKTLKDGDEIVILSPIAGG